FDGGSINGTIEAGTENNAHGEVSKLQEHPDTSNEAATQVENVLTRPRQTTRLPTHLKRLVGYFPLLTPWGKKYPIWLLIMMVKFRLNKIFCKHASNESQLD
ncbi:hypothetical protein Salat_2665900, partial [Sesamum alatum]